MKQNFLFKEPHAFLHGGDYNPDQWLKYPQILADDVRLMKEAHINCVSLGIFAWAALEVTEGDFHFEWLDERINTLYENGIYTILATPSGARPAWLDRKYPSAMRTAANGLPNHHGVRHNHCPSSPEYREKVRMIDEKLAERYGHHPGVILWHISNEFGGECYCENCVKRFRTFLKDKYGTIENLNDRWWTAFWSHTYTSFDEIDPPYENGETRMAILVKEWRHFTTWNTQDFINAEIRALRKYSDLPVTTNFMHNYPGLDYGKLQSSLDVISWDSYPVWGDPSQSIGSIAADTAFAHSSMRNYKKGKPFMLMESAPGQVNWHAYNKIRRPGLHRLSSLQTVACGSDSVLYFQIRKTRGGEEQFHGAVIDHIGTNETRIFKEVTQTGIDLEKLLPAAGSLVMPKAALLLDTPARWGVEKLSGLSKERKMLETAIRQYELYTRSTGLDLDVMTSDQDFSAYQLLILPMFYIVTPEMGEKLARFVENGGTLFATYLLGYVDDTLLAHLGGMPGAGLRKVFGIWNEETDTLYPQDRNVLVMKDGKRFEIRDFEEHIHAEGAEVLGVYGDDFLKDLPAYTCNTYGKGKAYYIAARTEDAFLAGEYRRLAEELGFDVMSLPENVEKHVREDAEHCFTFLLNFNNTPVELTGLPSGTDLLHGSEINGAVTLAPLDAVCIMSRKA